MKIKIIYFTFIYISIISNMNVFSQSDIKSSNVLKTKLIQPEYLKSGDTISIIAPSGVLTNFDDKIAQAKNLFEKI